MNKPLISYSKIYQNISKEAIWKAWSDVNRWSEWDTELEYCKMEGSFEQGNQFILKPKGGPKIQIHLSEVIPYKKFTDYCQFFGAKMIDDHELEETPEGLKIKSIISVKGVLSIIWWHLVAKNVAKSVPMQMDALVEYARTHYEK